MEKEKFKNSLEVIDNFMLDGIDLSLRHDIKLAYMLRHDSGSQFIFYSNRDHSYICKIDSLYFTYITMDELINDVYGYLCNEPLRVEIREDVFINYRIFGDTPIAWYTEMYDEDISHIMQSVLSSVTENERSINIYYFEWMQRELLEALK